MDETIDYKKTLHLPETGFDMRANLSQKEPIFRATWEREEIYASALRKNADKPKFVLHDGPPYANGDLHIGHALNKILKDIIIRYKLMRGFYALFVPGWDTHGLPIEHKVLTAAGKQKYEFTPLVIRQKAHAYALEQVKSQRAQFIEMSLITDWKQIYLTLDKSYEAHEFSVFRAMFFAGLIYKGLKPVLWSTSSRSALADAEVEYKDVTSPQIFIALPCEGDALKGQYPNLTLTVMTTTPWTLFANAGAAVNESLLYALVAYEDKTFIVANDLVQPLALASGWTEKTWKVINTLKGKELIGITYYDPIFNRERQVVSGAHVEGTSGTGIVHIAPLFGVEDFIVGAKYKLEQIMHVNDDGSLTTAAGFASGKFYLDANVDVINYLKEKQLLLAEVSIKHQYPHDWRTGKPVIYRATPQWFVAVEKLSNGINSALQEVNFYPEWGKKRLQKMTADRADWCISRQRAWGLPIAVFYDEDAKVVTDEAVFDYVSELFATQGSDVWFERSTDELLPPAYRGRGFSREMDTLDVWFDSGVSFKAANLGERATLPHDLVLEGSDQYRGWFNSSLTTSVALNGKAPFKTVISHGFVLGEDMQKMSKSKGDGLSPQKLIKQTGADILRLWVANTEYTSDVTISDNIMAQTADLYRNIRTKLRFFLGSLNHWSVNDLQPELTGFDAYIAERISNLKLSVHQNYDEFKFLPVVKEISAFINEISAFYLEYAKDVLYADELASKARQAVLTNIFNLTVFIISALAPIMPTTMDEAYAFLPIANKEKSVHLTTIDFTGEHNEKTEEKKWQTFWVLKDFIYKEIEVARKQGKIARSEEVAFNVKPSDLAQLNFRDGEGPFNNGLRQENLLALLRLGQLTFAEDQVTGIVTWNAKKCPRCWNYFSVEEANATLCARCTHVMQQK